jgi:hypothetical protein
VRGVARLISSASTICAMIGPGRNSNACALLVEDSPDAGDIGREQVRRALDALERNTTEGNAPAPFASIVLPMPGTSSIRIGAPQ